MCYIGLEDILQHSSSQIVNRMKTYNAYSTPFRKSQSPTLIVKSDKTWVDKGMKDAYGNALYFGGDTIDFIIAAGLASFRTEAFQWLNDFGAGNVLYADLSDGLNWNERITVINSHDTIPWYKRNPRIIRIERAISDTALIKYLKSLEISVHIAGQFLEQAFIEQGFPLITRDVVLLLKTECGTNQILTPFETKFIGPVSMTYYPGERRWICYVFVHIFDYLKILSKGETFSGDIYILNHYSLQSQCVSLVRQYEYVSFYLRQNQHSFQFYHEAKQCIPDAEYYFLD